MRTPVIAAAAIVVLTGAALWFIAATTRDDAPRRPAAAGSAPAAAVAEAPWPGGGPGGSRSPAPPGPEEAEGGWAGGPTTPGQVTATPAPAPAQAGPPAPLPLVPWENVRTSKLNAMRGPERDAVIFGMQNLQDELDGCFLAHNQPKDGVAAPLAPGASGEEDEGRTVLVLSLEARRGEVAVVDASVLVRGSAPDGQVACFQRLLQGHAFTALNARPGWRQKVRFPVTR